MTITFLSYALGLYAKGFLKGLGQVSAVIALLPLLSLVIEKKNFKQNLPTYKLSIDD